MRLKNGRNGWDRIGLVSVTVIAILCLSAIAMADIVPVNSNSKIIDGIEYYVQTDKAVYTLGGNVEMFYKVTNLNEYSVTFNFINTPEWNFWAEKDGISIWKKISTFLDIGISYSLASGESQIYPFSPPYFSLWDMKDNNGNLINPGEYQIIGGLVSGFPNNTYEYSKVAVPITIVPEPSTILIFSMGILGIFLRKYKNQQKES
jgi:hypothetical protein